VKVLCAFGDREHGSAALQAIRELVRDDDEVVAFHIIEPIDFPWAVGAEEFVSAARRAVPARQAQIARAAAATGLSATAVVDVRTPGETAADRIAREARERDVDLVVVVSRWASGLRGMLLGSVAQALLRLAPCPVIVVRPPARGRSE
jgi:nucleotide-binding universal stress UspA family protein